MVTERLIVSIAGMTSPACVWRIETALRAHEGVLRADVNLAAQQATVSYDPYVVAPRQLADEVERLGYDTPRWTAFRIGGADTGVRL